MRRREDGSAEHTNPTTHGPLSLSLSLWVGSRARATLERTGTTAKAVTELRLAREKLEGVPDDFVYGEFATRLKTAETAAKEAADAGDANKKGSDELARLRGRAQTQQTFIMELQEELATMKGLMFAADEIKRQYTELEERYQQLENEYTEKAEQEVVMRRGKERAEMALTVAQGELQQAQRDNESLRGKLKDESERLVRVRSDLNSLQEMYDDMVTKEQERLETNVDVGIQFAPIMTSNESQCEFKTPDMTMRQINCFTRVPHHRWGAPVVTPMLADERSVAMLQARIEIEMARPSIRVCLLHYYDVTAGVARCSSCRWRTRAPSARAPASSARMPRPPPAPRHKRPQPRASGSASAPTTTGPRPPRPISPAGAGAAPACTNTARSRRCIRAACRPARRTIGIHPPHL